MEVEIEKNEMATTGQELYHGVGRDHWWLTGKYEIIIAFFRDFRVPRSLVLDVGCGPGNLMEQIILSEPFISVVGIDLAIRGLEYAKTTGEKNLVQADMIQAPLKTATFDFVFAVDIFEHVADDTRLCGEIFRVLKPGGRALLVVPAHPILWGEHDDRFGHFRRYYLRDFRQLLSLSGFIILKLTYMQFFFYLPLLFFRKVKNLSRSKTQDFFPFPKALNRLLHHIVAAEYYLLRRLNLPIGTNVLCIVEKP